MTYSPNAINEAYWHKYTEEASRYYTDKMLELGTKEELRGSFHDNDAPNHLMYKVDTLYSKDGHRAYEFLLEYDVFEPTVGIYYGCKGLTLSGYEHNTEIEVFEKEWNQIKVEACVILNNTFPGKDFGRRFKKTNNANDNTFWPFWITLNEEEGIKEVGLRAVCVIRNVYQRFLNGEEMQDFVLHKVKLKPNITAFTNEAYEKFKLNLYVTPPKMKGTLFAKNMFQKSVELFERFLNNAEKRRIICKDNRYEYAWQVQQLSNIDFIRLIYSFFQCMTELGMYKFTDETGNARIPWADLCNIILTPEGGTYNESLRTQKSAALQNAKKEISQWMELMKEMLK